MQAYFSKQACLDQASTILDSNLREALGERENCIPGRMSEAECRVRGRVRRRKNPWIATCTKFTFTFTFTCYLDAATAENNTKPEEPTPEPPTPLYSIGTPSSSDENLFEDIKAQTEGSTPTGVSCVAALQDDVDLKVIAQSQGDQELEDDLTDSSKSGHLETSSEMTKLQKSFDVLLPQAAEETTDISESLKGLDPIENLPEIPNTKMDDFTLSSAVNSVFQPELNEEVDQKEEHELKQVIDDLNSATDLEWSNLDLPQRSVNPVAGASEKLRIALQNLKSQLTILR